MKRLGEVVREREEALRRHRAILSHLPPPSSREQSESAILASHFQFVRDDDADEKDFNKDYRVRIARRYYDRLFKEYAIVDLSEFKSGRIGMRWRIEREVIQGKGQFICGARKCEQMGDLTSYEVPFRYKEQGEVKMELVKVRVCHSCAEKLILASSKSESLLKKIETDESSQKRRKVEDSSDPQGPASSSADEFDDLLL